MPLYSNKGQFQSTYPPVRRRRRRNPLTVPLVIVVVLLLCGLAGIMVWGICTQEEPAPQPSVPAQPLPLELPEGVQVQPLMLPDLEVLGAEDFVTGLEGTDITVSFAEAPGNVLGEQKVTLTFTRQDQSCTHQTTLYRFHLEQRVAVAAHGEEVAGIRDFVPDESVEAAFVGKTPAEVDRTVCGDVALTISCGGREYPVTYAIEDRTPPQAAPKDVTVEAGTVVDPATLVENIVDDSQVTVTFAEAPDLTVSGSHKVELLLTDSAGNTSTVTAAVHVTPAKGAPVFKGLTDIRILVGNTISYKKGVTATDPQDGDVAFTVDTSGVDRNKPGTYTAYYTATDAEGHTTTQARKIVVEQIDRAAVEYYGQKVLDQIITPDMTRDQKILAVYKYTKSHVSFVGTSDKTDVVHGAYEGFTTGKGDCYTYYAMNVIFFDLLGIENLEVARTGGQTNHWWNLVRYEDGKYYHVDSCPVSVKIEGIHHWKMTDSDLQTYTKGVAWRKPNFYTYDKTLPEYQQIDIAP